jgi:hypothetical protein
MAAGTSGQDGPLPKEKISQGCALLAELDLTMARKSPNFMDSRR